MMDFSCAAIIIPRTRWSLSQLRYTDMVLFIHDMGTLYYSSYCITIFDFGYTIL